jgi:hypothetical protein
MPVAFRTLSNAYPTDRTPCHNANSRSNFPHQCAIRMGLCLADAGVDLSSCHAVRCWYGHGRRHILRAEELAHWLASPAGRFAIGVSETRRSNVNHSDYLGRTGIVFFQNFWGPGNQSDHIDLWNGVTARTGALDYFSRSPQVWFWEIL